jgi:hypothetical protein
MFNGGCVKEFYLHLIPASDSRILRKLGLDLNLKPKNLGNNNRDVNCNEISKIINNIP